jgi:hypothetical protein
MNTTTDIITATDTEMLADSLRMLEAVLADIVAVAPDSHGAAKAELIVSKIRARVVGLMQGVDDAHTRLADIGRVFGV